MHRIHLRSIVLALIVVHSTSILARNVPFNDSVKDNVDESDSRSHERSDFQSNMTSTSTPSFPTINDTFQNGSMTTAMSNGTKTTNQTSTSSMIAAIRAKKQSAVSNESLESVAAAKSSEEMQGTDWNDQNGTETAGPTIEHASNSTTNASIEASSSTETDMPSSMHANSTEESDGEGSNDIPNSDATAQRILELREKVDVWQTAVADYMEKTRRRRDIDWTQLAQPQDDGASSSSSDGMSPTVRDPSNQLISAAGTAMGDALKPAMELMNQGIDLLNDLYSNKFKEPTANSLESSSSVSPIANGNSSDPDEHFRGQMESLQSKLGDLGRQLQKVVGTFQQMQVPFLDGLINSGGLGGFGPLGNIGRLFGQYPLDSVLGRPSTVSPSTNTDEDADQEE